MHVCVCIVLTNKSHAADSIRPLCAERERGKVRKHERERERERETVKLAQCALKKREGGKKEREREIN